MRHRYAWAAGLFEGEGSIVLSYGRGNPHLRLQLAMQDEEPVRQFAEIFQAGVTTCVTAAGKTRWTCQISGPRAVDAFEKMREWLGARRTERYDELYTLWAARRNRSMHPNPAPPCGETTPRSTAGYERHRKRGEVPCVSCLAARREFDAAGRRRRASGG